MRKRGVILDEPEVVGVGGIVNVNAIVLGRESVGAVHDIVKSRLGPVNVNGLVVNLPENALSGVEGEVELGWGRAWAGNRDANDRSETSGVSAASGKAERGRGRVAAWSALVAEDGSLSLSVVELLVGTIAQPATSTNAEPVVANSLVGVDDHVVALANTEDKLSGREWLNGDEVARDNSERVVVKRDMKVFIDASVNETEKVLLARGEGGLGVAALPVVDSGAIDKDRLRSRRSLRLGSEDLEDGLMEPVGKRKCTKVDVPVGRGGTVDNDGAHGAVAILHGVVAVVPGRAVFSRLEGVRLGLARSNWAFSDTVRTIHLVRVQLAHTVPVNTGAIVGVRILDIDLNSVTPISGD